MITEAQIEEGKVLATKFIGLLQAELPGPTPEELATKLIIAARVLRGSALMMVVQTAPSPQAALDASVQLGGVECAIDVHSFQGAAAAQQ